MKITKKHTFFFCDEGICQRTLTKKPIGFPPFLSTKKSDSLRCKPIRAVPYTACLIRAAERPEYQDMIPSAFAICINITGKDGFFAVPLLIYQQTRTTESVKLYTYFIFINVYSWQPFPHTHQSCNRTFARSIGWMTQLALHAAMPPHTNGSYAAIGYVQRKWSLLKFQATSLMKNQPLHYQPMITWITNVILVLAINSNNTFTSLSLCPSLQWLIIHHTQQNSNFIEAMAITFKWCWTLYLPSQQHLLR